MCDQTEVAYLPDDVVWVKLGNVWWPGQVQDQEKLDNDVTAGLKKKPLAVVKFFDNAYEYVRNLDQIYHYNCLKKTDFIRKGLDLCRAKDASATMKKFPEDIATAELLTGGDPNIIHDPKFLPEKKFDYTELFNIKKVSPRGGGRGRGRGRPPNSLTSPGPSKLPSYGRGRSPAYLRHSPPTPETPRPITNPRLIQKVLTGTSDYESNIRVQLTPPPEEADVKTYTCSTCGYSTTRINVLILHNKAHMAGYSWPVGSPRVTGTPRQSATPASSKSDSKSKSVKRKNEDVESTPTASKRKNDSIPDKTPKKRGAKTKEERAALIKKKNEAIREKLLEDWDEEDPNEERREIERLRQSASVASSSDMPPPPPASDSQQKSCFDFVDNEDSIDVNRPMKFGQKLPRVISGEKSKKQSVGKIKQSLRDRSEDRQARTVEEADASNIPASEPEKEDRPAEAEETPEVKENDAVTKAPETTGTEREEEPGDKKEEENDIDEKERKVTETLDSEFETLLKETSVPSVPALPHSEQASRPASEDTPPQEDDDDLENESQVVESEVEVGQDQQDDSHPAPQSETSHSAEQPVSPKQQPEEQENQLGPEKNEVEELRSEDDKKEQPEGEERAVNPEPEEPPETVKQEEPTEQEEPPETLKKEEPTELEEPPETLKREEPPETLKQEEPTEREEPPETLKKEEPTELEEPPETLKQEEPTEREELHRPEEEAILEEKVTGDEQKLLEESEQKSDRKELEQQNDPQITEEELESLPPVTFNMEVESCVVKPSENKNIPQDIEMQSIIETEISVAEENIVTTTVNTDVPEITAKVSCDAVDGVAKSPVIAAEDVCDSPTMDKFEKIEVESVNSIMTDDTPPLEEVSIEASAPSVHAESATASDVSRTVEIDSVVVPDIESAKDPSGAVLDTNAAVEKDVSASSLETEEPSDAKRSESEIVVEAVTEPVPTTSALSDEVTTIEATSSQKLNAGLEDGSKNTEPSVAVEAVSKEVTSTNGNDAANTASVKGVTDVQQMELDINSMPIVLGEDIIGETDVKQNLVFCSSETPVQNSPQTITKLRIELRPPGETDLQNNQQVITIPGKSPVKTHMPSFSAQKKTQSSKVKANIIPQKGPGGASQVVILKAQSPASSPSKFTIGKNTVQKLSTGQIQLAGGQQVVTASQQVLTSGQLTGKVIIFPTSGGSNKIVAMTTQQHKTLAPATLAATTAKLQTVTGTRIVTKAQPNSAGTIGVNKQNQKVVINKGDMVATAKNMLFGKAQSATGIKSSQSILTTKGLVVGKGTPSKSVIITTVPKGTVTAQKSQAIKQKTKLVVQPKTKPAPVSTASQVKVVSKAGQPANTVYIQTTQGIFQATPTTTLVQRQLQQQQAPILQKRQQTPMKARQASPNILQRSQRKPVAAATTAAVPTIAKQQFLTIPSAAIHAGDIILTGDSVMLTTKQDTVGSVTPTAAAPSAAPVKMVYITMDEHGNYRQVDDSLISLEGAATTGVGDTTLFIDAGTAQAPDTDNIFLSIDASGNVINISHDESGRTPTGGQDILAKALADTQVLQSEAPPPRVEPQLFLSQAQTRPLPSLSHNVLETSLTLNQPIMTPLEVPSALATGPPPGKDELGPSMPLLTDELEERPAPTAPSGSPPPASESELSFRLTMDDAEDVIVSAGTSATSATPSAAGSLEFRTTFSKEESVFDAGKCSRTEFLDAGTVQEVTTEHPAERNAPDFLSEIGEGQTNGETTSTAHWEAEAKPADEATGLSPTLKRPAEHEEDLESVKRSRRDVDDRR